MTPFTHKEREMIMWELQRNMIPLIAPSVYKAWIERRKSETDYSWLAQRYADQRWNESDGIEAYDALVTDAIDTCSRNGIDLLCNDIAEAAAEYGSTTIGGHAVYLSSLTSVLWCTDEEADDWYN